MKKNYLSPAIEAIEVRFTFAICDPSPGGAGKYGDPDDKIDPFPKTAPRKPF